MKSWTLFALLGILFCGVMAGCGETSQQDDALKSQQKAEAEAKRLGVDKDSY